MIKSLLLLSLLALPGVARAQSPDVFVAGKTIDKSSAAVVVVTASTSAFTLTDAPQMTGSDLVIVQSTYAAGAFCCSSESDATSANTAGGKGCIRAKKEPGLGFYELEVRRWWQNLRVYCKGLDLLQNGITLNVRQSK